MIVRSEQLVDRKAMHGVHAGSFPTSSEARLVDALRTANGVGLGPVAVLPACRQRGYADRLIREGLARCLKAGYGFVVVLGDPAYYGRFDFVAADSWDLHDEYGGGKAFQAIELRPDSIPASGGLVRYAPAFAALSGDQPG